MNAFITGISGFVGGHLAEHLLASGDALLARLAHLPQGAGGVTRIAAGSFSAPELSALIVCVAPAAV